MLSGISRHRPHLWSVLLAAGIFLLAACSNQPPNPNGKKALDSLIEDTNPTVGINAPTNFVYTNDDGGANDENAQTDLTRSGIDTISVPGSIGVEWSWDEADPSPIFQGQGQSGDACMLFDTDNDGNANYAICNRVDDAPIVQISGYPRVFRCDDGNPDKCSQSGGGGVGEIIPTPAGVTCVTNQTATDPFPLGSYNPNDTTSTCWIPLSVFGANVPLELVNVCTFPSAANGGNNNPNDCVNAPRSGFLTIIKKSSDNLAGTEFTFGVNPATNNGTTSFPAQIPNIGTTNEYKVVDRISVDPTKTYTLSETIVTAGWQLDSISCKIIGGAPTTGTPNIGTKSISGVQVGPGQETECTFTNSQQKGSLQITKSLTGGPAGFTGPFAINYDCSDGTTHDGTANLNAGASTTVSDIPTGTTCTVTEPTLPAPPTGYTFGTQTFTDTSGTANDGIVTITPAGATVTVTVNNTLTRDTGSLKITKTLSGGPAGYTGPFTIAYDCDDGTAHDGSVVIASGTSSTPITGIPTGTQCTISETPPTAPTGYTFGTPTFSPSATVTITTKGVEVEVTVANTLTRDTGSLKITKTLSGGPAGYTGPFDIAYDCTDNAFDGSVQLNSGGETTVSGIPTGTECTVTETLPTAPTGYTFGTPTISPVPATITKDTTVTVTVVNTLTRDTGSLKITKTLTGGPAGYTGPFDIAYDCTDNAFDGSTSLNVGAETIISGIPTGTECTVTETLPTAPTGYTFGTPTISPVPATITKDTTVTVTVANTLTRDTGSLKISKTLSGGPAGYTGPFTVNYDCNDGNTHDGTAQLNAGGDTTVTGIPTGTECTVTETLPTAPTGYTFGTPTISPVPATITKDTTVTVTVANTLTRDTGSLKITKTLSGGPAGYSGPFTVNYDCTDNAFDGSTSLNAGGDTTISGIPTGTECTVTETLPTAPPGYTFGTPTISPVPATITKDATVTVTVANTLTRDTGSLKITKTLSGGPAGYTGPFTIAYNCDDGTAHDGSVVIASGTSSTPITGIPTGTQCTISETPPAAPTGYTFGTPTFSPSATVTITPKDAEVEVTVANTLTRDTGSLKITKTLSGGPAGYTGPFTIAYDCNDGTTHDGSVVIASGTSSTPVTGIPTGTQCTISETPPAAPTGYTFSTPTFSPSATVTITPKDAEVEVTVANTLTRDTGSLKITKTLSGGPAGYTGPFTVNYDCSDGAAHDGTAQLNSGGETTVSGIPTGTECTVTETLPTAPPGYTFGTPTISPVPAVVTKDTTITVTVANTLTRDTGSLKITKTLSGGPAGYTGPFTIAYDCDDGTTHDGSVVIASGISSAPITGIPTGTQCTISETPPAAPTGYTFGTPTFNPSAIVTITTKGVEVEVTVANTLTRDTGSLKISKTLTGGPAGYTGPFTVNYDCNDGNTHDGSVQLNSGGDTTVTGIPTGTECTVTETLPTAPTGYTFGTPTISPVPATITKDATVTVTVANTLTRDTGSLKITKTLSGGPAGYTGPFTIAYDCDDGTTHDGSVTIASGTSSTPITGIPTGTQCTVSETPPAAPTGYTFGTPTFSPSATVTITTKGVEVGVTVNNTLTRDTGSLKIIKVVSGAPAGFTSTFAVEVECTNGGGTYNPTIAYPTPGDVTINNIPTSSCTVTENTLPAPPAGYIWGTPSISGSPATITKNGTAQVTVTNILKPVLAGCTYTQGYWKTHSRKGPAPYDDGWQNIGSLEEDTLFFTSGQTWYQVFNVAPRGNAYYILAQQYMAAKLNVLNGAQTTAAVDAAITFAENFFSTNNPNSTLSATLRSQVLSAASTLDAYNNGLIGPGHCGL